MNFSYRVVFLHQPGCPACHAMIPIWESAANELSEEYPHLNIGFGEWDVTKDNWAFADSVISPDGRQVDGTPNFVIFDDGTNVIGLNTEGIISKTELKNFILNSVERS